MTHDQSPTFGGPDGPSRRIVLVRGTAATLAAWSVPTVMSVGPAFGAVGSPAPAPGSGTGGRATQSISLVSSLQTPGTPDPLVEILFGGAWRAAQAVVNAFYVPFPGTGFVNAGGSASSNTTFVFRAAFTLPAAGTFDSPTLSGMAQADNAVSVRLNASPVLAAQVNDDTTANFDTSRPANFSTADATLFLPGLNYLYFDVRNNLGPFALDFAATVTSRS